MRVENSSRLYFLDGIRGWGSLVVLMYHVFGALRVSPKSTDFLFKVPFFNGTLAVWIFFIISGFSLSISYCLIKENNILTRIALGRYFRLSIPILIISLLILCLFRLGLFPKVSDRLPVDMRGLVDHIPTLWEAIKSAIYGVYFDNSAYKILIPPLWTMMYEFWGSLLILCSLSLIGKLPKRIFIYMALIFFAYEVNPYYTTFFIGLIFAEIYSFPRLKENLVLPAKLLLIPAIYLCTKLPGAGANFYLIASFLLSFSLIFNPIMCKFLSNKLSCFLGSISYTLYLSHGAILLVFTCNIGHILGFAEGNFFSWGKLFLDMETLVISLLFAYILRPVDRFAIKVSKDVGRLFFKVSQSQSEKNSEVFVLSN